MRQIPERLRVGTFMAFCIVLGCEAIAFHKAALLHTGAFGVPALLPAMIVEGLCGLGCLFSAYGVFTHKRWALRIAIPVQIFILAGVLLGLAALARSAGLRTPINLSLHALMLGLILSGLALLAIPATRQAFLYDQNQVSGEG